jgi:transposase
MLIDTKGLRVFIYKDQIDMRSGFEKLLRFVRDEMKNNINQGHLYLFFGKNRRRLKALYFDGTGLVLIAKRIERGKFMSRNELGDVLEISLLELKQIFAGGLVIRPKIDRSMENKSITQMGPAFLPKGFVQQSLYAQS